MKKSTGITRMARHLMAVILTVSLVCGLAGLEDGAYAASGTSPFANTRSSYNHNARFNGNLVVHGVDVSYFQATGSDWNAAKLNGCDYTIMRVTYTTYGNGSLNIDSKFATHYSKAKAAGVMKGVYVFSQAKSAAEARKEAQYAVNRLRALGIGPKDLELPVYMDYEFAGKSSGKNKGRLYGIKQKTAIEAVNAFADVIRANGYDPGVYANTNFFKSYLANGTGLAADIDMWCAQYYSRNQSGVDYSKWQYSSSARIDGMLSYTGLQGRIDADFWYINKKKATSSVVTKICGRTTLSRSAAKAPKFKLYNGSKLLREGVDYTVGGIRNNRVGNGYAYIKGIGDYGGYALIPIKIAKSSSGKSSDVISCANYLKKASKERSKYISVTPITYKVGNTYVVQDYLNIRKGAGTNYGRVLRSDLSDSMRAKTAEGNKYAVLKPGVKVKCLKVSGSWMKISGGWICCREGSDIYVK